MTNTNNTLPQQNTALEQSVLQVVQHLNSAGMTVSQKELPDRENFGGRGYCPGVQLSVTHKNGAMCTLEIKHLNDLHGGLRASLTLPIEGADTSSDTSIRKEDPSTRDFQERLTALVAYAIAVLGISGKEDPITELQMPR